MSKSHRLGHPSNQRFEIRSLRMIRKTSGAFALLLSFGSFLISQATAQLDDSTNKESLRGLNGVVVLVRINASPDAERDGITKEKLQTDVELKLRQAGIPVVAMEELKKTIDNRIGWLDLSVSALKYEDGTFYACNLQLKLMQHVFLARDPSKSTFATTWSTGSVGVFGLMRLQGIRQEVNDKVGEFANSYLAVNPK
jgi:hypothetical protein